MATYQIVDNVQNKIEDKLKYIIRQSTSSLYAGIGYFLQSDSNLLDLIEERAKTGTNIKIVVGNLYKRNSKGKFVLNPYIDAETSKLVLSLYQKHKNIEIKHIKKSTFLAKFFLGNDTHTAYLLGGSTNVNDLESFGDRLEYNMFIEDTTKSISSVVNKTWFEKVWDNHASHLTESEINNLKFILKKSIFDIHIDTKIYEKGAILNKTFLQLQVEVLQELLKKSGLNCGNVRIVGNHTDNVLVNTILNGYKYLRENNNLEVDFIEDYLSTDPYKKGIVTESLEATEFTDYYYSLLNEFLEVEEVNFQDLEHIVNITKLFKIFYDDFFNKINLLNQEELEEGQPVIDEVNPDDIKDIVFEKPTPIDDYRFEWLLRNIEELKGDFDDDWLFQYQYHDSKTLLERYNYREKGAYIAHEAGMGKSPIMGKFMKEVLLKDSRTKILLACPSTLQHQWGKEVFQDLFGLDYKIVDSDLVKRHGDYIWEYSIPNIISIDYLKNILDEEDEEKIANISPDILIIDEAHLLKNEDAKRFQSIKKLTPRFVVLASATPLQNNLKEFLVQMSLIDPEVDTKNENLEYILELKNKYLIRRTRDKDLAEVKSISQAERKPEKVTIQNTPQFKKIYDALEEDLRNGGLYYYKFLGEIRGEKTRYDKINNQMAFMFLQQITSSVAACVSGFENLKRKISCIVNNDLELLDKETISEFETKEERDVLNKLMSYKKNITNLHKQKLQADIHLLEHYLKGFLLENGQPTLNPKEEMLINIFKKPELKNRQCIVFVKYIATGESIKKTLINQGLKAEFFTGDLSKDQKDFIVGAFRRGEIQILICTDAANAGLNLQHCNFLINYDLNWNPMIVEQRIGRVHRIGQKSKEVLIYNLILEDTIDGRIAEKMDEKIKTFDTLFISSDHILGIVEQCYMGAEDVNNLNIPDFTPNGNVEEMKKVLENNSDETDKMNMEYIYSQEALKQMFMWILSKYNLEYAPIEDGEYYVKFNDKVCMLNLNHVYYMIENEDKFFKGFQYNNHINEIKQKIAQEDIKDVLVNEENVSVCNALEYLEDLQLSLELKEKLSNFIKEMYGKKLFLFQLDIGYQLRKEGEEFNQKEFKTISITEDFIPYSDDTVLQFLSVLPYKLEGDSNFKDLDENRPMSQLYNMLSNILIYNKENELDDFKVEILSGENKAYDLLVMNFVE